MNNLLAQENRYFLLALIFPFFPLIGIVSLVIYYLYQEKAFGSEFDNYKNVLNIELNFLLLINILSFFPAKLADGIQQILIPMLTAFFLLNILRLVFNFTPLSPSVIDFFKPFKMVQNFYYERFLDN